MSGLSIGQRVRFAAGLYAGCEGTVERIKDNGTVVVRGDPLHGRGGPGFSANPEERVAWGLAPIDARGDGITIEHRNSNEYTLHNLPRNDGIWLRVENFDVNIKRTDEGLVVDLYDASDEADGDPMGSAYAFDADTMAHLEEN